MALGGRVLLAGAGFSLTTISPERGLPLAKSPLMELAGNQFGFNEEAGFEREISQTIAKKLGHPNLVALGSVDYSKLPQILSQCAVGLLPMSDDASNAGRSPMKFFEYLAAGLPVVSTPLPALSDLGPYHGVASGPIQFAEAISAALSGRGPQAPAITDPLLQANSWDARLDSMMRLIEATAHLGNLCDPVPLREQRRVAEQQGNRDRQQEKG